jgi:hypothetical protein
MAGQWTESLRVSWLQCVDWPVHVLGGDLVKLKADPWDYGETIFFQNFLTIIRTSCALAADHMEEMYIWHVCNLELVNDLRLHIYAIINYALIHLEIRTAHLM